MMNKENYLCFGTAGVNIFNKLRNVELILEKDYTSAIEPMILI